MSELGSTEKQWVYFQTVRRVLQVDGKTSQTRLGEDRNKVKGHGNQLGNRTEQ